MSELTSIHLTDDLAARLDQLAAALDRPRAWLIEQAIARYVDEEASQVSAITEALAEYRKGGAALHPHDDVMERLEARIVAKTGNADPLA